jgi:hypothetical protein
MLIVSSSVNAQYITEITGRVTDSNNGEPVPFVNIYFKGTSSGTMSDLEGRYALRTTEGHDSLVFSYIGYNVQIIPVVDGERQTIDVALESEYRNLNEVVVYSGENPAWAVLRRAVDAKKIFDKRSLEYYEYDTYTRNEFFVNNFTAEAQKSKTFQKILQEIDSNSLEQDERKRALLPVFLSESQSRFFVKNNPFARTEEVKKSRISGLGVEDGAMVSQIAGATYQQYNFYENWVTIMEKEFVSPLADGWRMFYDYQILDTVALASDSAIHLKVLPKRLQDPAFEGEIWISKSDFSLKMVDVSIGRSANLNFIEKIRIYQELGPSEAGPLLPVKTKIWVEVRELTKNSPGLLLRFYNASSNWILNESKPTKIYDNRVSVSADLTAEDDSYWDAIRPENLTVQELKTYETIEQLKEVPVVKTYSFILKSAVTGYFRTKKIDFGPWLYAYAFNQFEGHSFRLGFRTNEYLSDKVYLKAYLGYGTDDAEWKYGVTGGYIISRKKWTLLELHSSRELEQLGLRSESLQDDNYIFLAATRWGRSIRPYYHFDHWLRFGSETVKGLYHTVQFRNEHYNPQFPFYYYTMPGSQDSPLNDDLTINSFKIGARWGRDELFVINGNDRVSVGPRRAPIIRAAYTYGRDASDLSDITYHKIELGFSHHLRLGGFGISRYRIDGGYYLGIVPYLILENHVGNESIFFTNAAFNTMNFFEFVSDRYASLRYEHHFGGLILNKIPLMRKLKWRLHGSANVLYGSLSQENIDLIPETDPEGNTMPPFKGLGNVPYVELGYGLENVLKFMRIDAFHRLTYRNDPGATRFSIKVSFQVEL